MYFNGLYHDSRKLAIAHEHQKHQTYGKHVRTWCDDDDDDDDDDN